MEQLPDASVGNAVHRASVGEPAAVTDLPLGTNAPVSSLDMRTSFSDSLSNITTLVSATTSAAVVTLPANTYGQHHDVDTRTNKRRRTTPMDCALVGDVCDVRAMPASGVDVIVVDEAGLSAVSHATACGPSAVVQVLLAAEESPVVIKCESIAPVDTSLAVDAPSSTLSTCTASTESSFIPTLPSHAHTATAVVSTPRNKRSRQHALSTRMNKRGHTLLMQLAIAGDVRRVRALIAAGVDVNVVDDAGWSAVVYATVCGHRDVVQVLLAAKATPVVVSDSLADLVDRMCGGQGCRYPMRMLLQTKAMLRDEGYVDMEEEDEDVGEEDEDDPGEIEEEGAGEVDDDVDWCDEDVKEGGCDMQCADDDVFDEDIDEEYGYEMLGICSVTMREGEDWPQLLYWAAERGYVDVVKLLLAAGADVHQHYCVEYYAKGETAMNALHIACEGGHVEVVKALLAAGATAIIDVGGSVYMKDHLCSCDMDIYPGMTALHLAVEMGHVEVARVLIAAGAGVDLRSHDGWTGEDGGPTALYRAVRDGFVSLVRMLLDAGANLHFKYYDGEDIFTHASRDANRVVLKMLLAAGADVNARDGKGDTPLHRAASNGQGVAVKLLLAAGTDVNVKEKYGYTPLHLAVADGHVSVVKLLIAAGADVTAINKYGCSALHTASQGDDEEMLNALLDPVAFCANMRATGTVSGQ